MPFRGPSIQRPPWRKLQGITIRLLLDLSLQQWRQRILIPSEQGLRSIKGLKSDHLPPKGASPQDESLDRQSIKQLMGKHDAVDRFSGELLQHNPAAGNLAH